MPRSPAVWTKSVQNVCRKFWKVTRRWRPASATRGRSTLRVKLDFARIGPPVVVVKTNGDNARPRAVLLHPVAVGAELPDDLAREVHQADLVLLRPIDEPPFAELPLNAYSAILKVEVDPLQPKAFAQPEAGPQRNQEEKEVARACTRGVQKSGLVLRGKRRDPLLLVDRLVQQLAEPDGGILQRQTTIVDQPLVSLLDRSQNVSAEALAGLCSEQPFEEHLEVLTPNRRHCHGSEHGEGVLPKRPLIVKLGEGVDCLECQPLGEVLRGLYRAVTGVANSACVGCGLAEPRGSAASPARSSGTLPHRRSPPTRPVNPPATVKTLLTILMGSMGRRRGAGPSTTRA